MFFVNYCDIAPTIIIGKRWANVYKPKQKSVTITCTDMTIRDEKLSIGSTRGYKASYFKGFIC